MMKAEHSIKVSVTYRKVAKILKLVKQNGMGLKAAVYGLNPNFNRNNERHLVLATKILEKFLNIEHVLETTQILSKEPRLDPWLGRVLIYELLWRKDLDHPCKPVQTVIQYKKELHDALATYKEPDSLKPTIKVIKPRYARVNTFKKSVSDVINQLRNEGMVLVPSLYETYSEYLEALTGLQYNHFMIDFHIKEMLVFTPDAYIFKHEFYNDGTFILQDKASCLSPLMLDPPEGSVVLDMCAAPGMKTNYLANQVGENGRVYAVERNQERYITLSKLMRKHGMENVHCMHRDALSILNDELADIEYILVDPSCSGSGMVDRVEFAVSKSNRLEKLAGFQSKILSHALTGFPKVKRVVYSTCSINPEENEEVVAKVLGATSKFKLVNLQEKMGANWNNFGSDKYGEIGTSCLYCVPEKDFTNGFFVALFERKEKRKKKRQHEDEDAAENDENVVEKEDVDEESSRKKKKKKAKAQDAVEEVEHLEEPNIEKKKKNKAGDEQNVDVKKDKKKKKKKDSLDFADQFL